MKIDRKVNWAIGLSITAIVSVVTLILLWVCNVWKLSVIGIETFIGVIVALLAIIVTFVVGWQIYNTIEIKNKLSELDRLKSILEEQRLKNQQIYHDLRHSVFIGYALNEENSNDADYSKIFGYYMRALENALLANNFTNIEVILESMERYVKALYDEKQCLVHGTKYIKIIKRSNMNIRNASCFSLVESRYDDIMIRFAEISKIDF